MRAQTTESSSPLGELARSLDAAARRGPLRVEGTTFGSGAAAAALLPLLGADPVTLSEPSVSDSGKKLVVSGTTTLFGVDGWQLELTAEVAPRGVSLALRGTGPSAPVTPSSAWPGPLSAATLEVSVDSQGKVTAARLAATVSVGALSLPLETTLPLDADGWTLGTTAPMAWSALGPLFDDFVFPTPPGLDSLAALSTRELLLTVTDGLSVSATFDGPERWDAFGLALTESSISLSRTPVLGATVSVVEVEAKVAGALPVRLTADSDGLWQLQLSGDVAPASGLEALSDLLGLPGDDPIAGAIGALERVQLHDLRVRYDASRGELREVALQLITASPLGVEELALSNLLVDVASRRPRGAASPELELSVAGSLSLDGTALALRLFGSGRGEWAVELTEAVRLPSLRGLGKLLGDEGLFDVLPAGLSELAFDVTDLSFGLDPATRRPTRASFGVTTDAPWEIVEGELRVESAGLSVEIGFDQGKPQVSGRVFGTAAFAGARATLGASLGEAMTFSLQLPELSPQAIAEALMGDADLPQGLDRLPTFTNVDLSVTPATGAYSVSGTVNEKVGFLEGIAFEGVTLSVSRAGAADGAPPPATQIDLSLGLAGPVDVVEGIRLSNLRCAIAGTTGGGWSVTGGASAELFGSAEELGLSVTGAGGFSLDWRASAPIRVGFSDAGSLELSALSLSRAVREGGSDWTASGSGALRVGDLLQVGGTLGLESTATRTALVLSKLEGATLGVDLPLVPGVDEWTARVETTVTRVALLKSAQEGFALEGSCRTAFRGVPGAVGEVLPASIDTTLKVGSAGVSLVVGALFEDAAIPLPKAGDTDLGEILVSIRNLNLTLGSQLTLAADLDLGLPPSINGLFGKDERGNPKRLIVNPKQQLRLSASPETGIGLVPLTPPLALGGLKTTDDGLELDVDLGDVGELVLSLAELRFDGASFATSGKVVQKRPLAIPLGFVKELLESAGAAPLAALVPDALPLEGIDLVSDGKLDATKLLAEIQKRVPAAKSSLDALEPALALLADRSEELPSAFKDYLDVRVPEDVEFQFAMMPSSGMGLSVDVRVPKESPVRVLVPTMGALGPALMGVTLRRLSFGEVFGGNLVLSHVDGVFDFFDLLVLGLVLGLPAEKVPLLPDPKDIHRRVSAENVFLAIVPQLALPIPIFYDNIGFSRLGLDGLDVDVAARFPGTDDPKILLGMLQDMLPFFTEEGSLLEQDFFAAHEMPLAFSVRPGSLTLPKYLGGRTLGDQGELFSIDLGEGIVGLLNAIKSGQPSKLLQVVPLERRFGDGDAGLAGTGLTLGGSYAVTTPDEYASEVGAKLRGRTQLLSDLLGAFEAMPIDGEGVVLVMDGRVDLEGIVAFEAGLAMVGEKEGMATALGMKGSIGEEWLELDALGVIRVSTKPEKDEPVVRMAGRATLRVLGRDVLAGTIALSDDAFRIAGKMDVFDGVDGIELGGEITAALDFEGFEGSAKWVAKIGDWAPWPNVDATLTHRSLSFSAAWIGQTVSFEAKEKGTRLEMRGTLERGVSIAGFRLGASAQAFFGIETNPKKPEEEIPQLTLTGDVELLGASEGGARIDFSKAGFLLTMTGKVFGVASASLTASGSSTGFDAKLRVVAEVDDDGFFRALAEGAGAVVAASADAAREAVGVAEKGVAGASEALGAASTALDLANEASKAAGEAMRAAQVAYDAAEVGVKAARGAKDAAKGAVEAAEKTVSAAAETVRIAEGAVTAADESVGLASDAVGVAEKAVNGATDAYNAAASALTGFLANVGGVIVGLFDKKKQKQLEKAKKAAKRAVTIKQTAKADADRAFESAKTDLEKARAEVRSANVDLEKARVKVKNQTSAFEKAERELDTANGTFDAANADLEKKKAAAAAEAEKVRQRGLGVDNAKSALASAREELAKAQDTLSKFERTLAQIAKAGSGSLFAIQTVRFSGELGALSGGAVSLSVSGRYLAAEKPITVEASYEFERPEAGVAALGRALVPYVT